MSILPEVPSNPTIAAGIASIAAGNATDFRTALNSRLADIDANIQLDAAFLELLTDTLGNGAISGGAITAGAGLSVNVAALSALVGSIIRTDATQIVGGLLDGFNYLFLRQDGSWTVNQTDVPPSGDGYGEALKWGMVYCDLGAVTLIDDIRAIFGARFLRSDISVITLADADYDLSVYESNARVLEFQGTLTGNRAATVSTPEYGEWVVYNNTSGGHTVTLNPITAGTGIAVAAGKRAILYFDGTNVVRATADV